MLQLLRFVQLQQVTKISKVKNLASFCTILVYGQKQQQQASQDNINKTNFCSVKMEDGMRCKHAEKQEIADNNCRKSNSCHATNISKQLSIMNSPEIYVTHHKSSTIRFTQLMSRYKPHIHTYILTETTASTGCTYHYISLSMCYRLNVYHNKYKFCSFRALHCAIKL